MTIDGKSVNYKDWTADDVLREATASGMDAYFSELTQGAEMNIPEGTPVTGYRFMYLTNKGELWSPFFNNTLQEASAYLNIPIKDDEAAMNIQQRAGSNVKKDEINVDPTNRGFYYWPDRGMAEDYMKVAISRMGHEFRRPSDFVVKTTTVTEMTRSFGERVNYLLGKKHKWLPKYEQKISTHIQAPRAQDEGDKERFQSQDKKTTQKQTSKSTRATTTSEFVQFPLGQYVLLRVEGTSVANTNGDAGFTMNEMKVVGDPIISIPITEPYDSLHNP